jgi:hypothetical protein
MTARELEEYRALRDTIRERSTARVWVALAGFAVWATLSVAIDAVAAPPLSALIPLLVLLLTFEIVLALHIGVERVGRYLQIFFEEPGERGWEHVAMRYGQEFPGSGADPLFAACFWSAIILNLIPAIVGSPVPSEWLVVGGAHLLVFARIAVARRRSAGQRAQDLERFTRLQTQPERTSSGPGGPVSAGPAQS